MKDIFSSANNVIDTSGLRCPETLMILRKTIRKMKIGEILLIITDDPTTERDIPSFCRFMQHKLLLKKVENIPYEYLIQKGLII